MKVTVNSNSAIIVLERRPQWRPELQREFQRGRAARIPNQRLVGCDSMAAIQQQSVDVFGCDTLRDLLQFHSTCRAQVMPHVMVLDLRFGPSQVLQFLTQSQVGLSAGATVILGTVEHLILEPTLRELGASSFQVLPLPRERLGEVCRRLLAGR